MSDRWLGALNGLNCVGEDIERWSAILNEKIHDQQAEIERLKSGAFLAELCEENEKQEAEIQRLGELVKNLTYANEQHAYLWDVEAEREKLKAEIERLRWLYDESNKNLEAELSKWKQTACDEANKVKSLRSWLDGAIGVCEAVDDSLDSPEMGDLALKVLAKLRGEEA